MSPARMPEPFGEVTPPRQTRKAQQITDRIAFFDGHNDFLLRLTISPEPRRAAGQTGGTALYPAGAQASGRRGRKRRPVPAVAAVRRA